MVAGDNATLLQNIKTGWEGRSGAPANRRPKDYFEGKQGTLSTDGNASTTAFNIPHGIVNDAGNGVIPSSWNFEPTNAVSSAAHSVTATTTNLVVTYAAAPASGTGNVQGRWQAFN